MHHSQPYTLPHICIATRSTRFLRILERTEPNYNHLGAMRFVCFAQGLSIMYWSVWRTKWHTGHWCEHVLTFGISVFRHFFCHVAAKSWLASSSWWRKPEYPANKNHLTPWHWQLSHMPQSGCGPRQWWDTASSQWQRLRAHGHQGRLMFLYNPRLAKGSSIYMYILEVCIP